MTRVINLSYMTTGSDFLLGGQPLTFPWSTEDPFLFCAHHEDHYPAGDEKMAPLASLTGRQIGSDFSRKDGFSMYHGHEVPGFPQHPHRGFETVTIARRGYIDHADSMGATARFGQGDVQWVTTGAGVVHSEMFPLVHQDEPNPTELFQIWLNLPRVSKMVEPHFSMFWATQVPKVEFETAGARGTVAVVAGTFAQSHALPPPPHSWASQKDAHVQIWTLRLDPGAKVRLPATTPTSNRNLYFFKGDQITLRASGDEEVVIDELARLKLRPEIEIEIEAGAEECELLLLGGEPIREPVANYGPFVMNTREELEQTFRDYNRTRFGGWPWSSDGPVHPRDKKRFALHADGRLEEAAD